MTTGLVRPCCPRCGELPRFVLGGGTQAFCFTDGCAVMTWNPYIADFEATAHEIDLSRDDER